MNAVRRLFAVTVVASIARGHGGHAAKEGKGDATWDAEGYAREHVCTVLWPPSFIRRAYVVPRCTRSIICTSKVNATSSVR